MSPCKSIKWATAWQTFRSTYSNGTTITRFRLNTAATFTHRGQSSSLQSSWFPRLKGSLRADCLKIFRCAAKTTWRPTKASMKTRLRSTAALRLSICSENRRRKRQKETLSFTVIKPLPTAVWTSFPKSSRTCLQKRASGRRCPSASWSGAAKSFRSVRSVYRRRAVRASRSTQITHRNGCNICSRIPALLSS